MTSKHLKSFSIKASLAFACSMALTAHAQDAACRLTQTITVAGQKIETDQCLQNRGMDAAQFKALCNDGSEGIPSMGIPPMKVVSLAACPTKAINVCEGFAQGKLASFYYNQEDGLQRKQALPGNRGQVQVSSRCP